MTWAPQKDENIKKTSICHRNKDNCPPTDTIFWENVSTHISCKCVLCLHLKMKCCVIPPYSFLSLAGPQTALHFLAVLLQTLGCCPNQQGVAPCDTSIWKTPPSYWCRPQAVAGKEFLTKRFWKSPTFITTSSILLVKSLHFQGQMEFNTVAPTSDQMWKREESSSWPCRYYLTSVHHFISSDV